MLSIIYLNIIPLFEIIILIISLYLTFVQKTLRLEVIFSFMYAIMLPDDDDDDDDDGQSNRPKHVGQIYRIYYSHISFVFQNIKTESIHFIYTYIWHSYVFEIL